MVNRTKQPEGCIGTSEKYVLAWKSLSSLYREEKLKCFFLAIVVLQILFERMLQEELSVKVVLKPSL